MIRTIHVLAVALTVTCLHFCSSPIPAQKSGEFIPGTVVEIKPTTGKNYKMKVKGTADDAEFEVPITVRTPLLVSAKGDEAFLRKDVFIQVKALKNAMDFSGKDFTVFIGNNTPNANLSPDPTDSTKKVFNVAGKVLGVEGGAMLVQCGPQPVKLTIESGVTVMVKISNPALIKEGDTVEVEGTLIKSKKTLNAKSINVTSAEALKGEEFFAELDEQKKSKTTKSRTTTKPKTTEGDDDAAGTGATKPATAADPFGVLKDKKTAPKSKTEKPADANKDDAKPEEPKKDAAAKEKDKPAAGDKKE